MAEFVSEDAHDATVVRVVGDLDLDNVQTLVDAVRPHFAAGHTVRLDFSELRFIDSTGLGALVRLQAEAVRRDSAFSINSVNDRLYRLFEVMGLTQVFDMTRL